MADALFARPLHPYTQSLAGSDAGRITPMRRAPRYRSEATCPASDRDWRGCRFASRCPYRADALPRRGPAATRPRRRPRTSPAIGSPTEVLTHRQLKTMNPCRRILVVECMQEISSFNPLPSGYENFHIERGDEMLRHRGRNTAYRRRARGVRRARPESGPSASRRARRQRRAVVGRRLEAAVRRGARVGRGRRNDGHRRRLLFAARRDGRRWRTRPGRLPADANPQDRRHDNPDRHLARSARHPDRPHAAPDRRRGDLPHLSACRLRRHGPACGASCCCA